MGGIRAVADRGGLGSPATTATVVERRRARVGRPPPLVAGRRACALCMTTTRRTLPVDCERTVNRREVVPMNDS